MSEVKTYAVNCNDAWLNTEGDDISGSYVKYADYLELTVQLANAESKCRELAGVVAENAALKKAAEFATAPDMWIEQADGMLDYRYCEWYVDVLKAAMETPATDAFLAEVRASAIPEGYVLVPQQIFLDPSDIESICSQCSDGHESGYGDFTDGLLWVGNIQRDDGSIVHGLHISSADYTEEGGVTVYEFAAQLRKGAAL